MPPRTIVKATGALSSSPHPNRLSETPEVNKHHRDEAKWPPARSYPYAARRTITVPVARKAIDRSDMAEGLITSQSSLFI
jgi:hypothetical protein